MWIIIKDNLYVIRLMFLALFFNQNWSFNLSNLC